MDMDKYDGAYGGLDDDHMPFDKGIDVGEFSKESTPINVGNKSGGESVTTLAEGHRPDPRRGDGR